MALLTPSELAWLKGEKQVSKVYAYRLKSDIKKKLGALFSDELPLLIQSGYLTIDAQQLSANPQNLAALVAQPGRAMVE